MTKQYDENISDYMLLVASNLVVSVASKNPEKIYNVLLDIEQTVGSYTKAAKTFKEKKDL